MVLYEAEADFVLENPFAETKAQQAEESKRFLWDKSEGKTSSGHSRRTH